MDVRDGTATSNEPSDGPAVDDNPMKQMLTSNVKSHELATDSPSSPTFDEISDAATCLKGLAAANATQPTIIVLQPAPESPEPLPASCISVPDAKPTEFTTAPGTKLAEISKRRPLAFLAETLLALTLGAQGGCACRYFLTWALMPSLDTAAALFPALPANVVGCFIAGVLCDGGTVAAAIADVNGALVDQAKRAASEPLPALAGLPAVGTVKFLLCMRTAFCGSLTTFSSWNQGMVQLLAVGDWRSALIGYVMGLTFSLASCLFGQRTAIYIYLRASERSRAWVRNASHSIVRRLHEWQSCTLCSVFLLLTALLTTETTLAVLDIYYLQAASTMNLTEDDLEKYMHTGILSERLCFGLLSAPIGAILRWRLAKLNSISSSFAFGTFTANMIGCACIGLLYAFIDNGLMDRRIVEIEILRSLGLGFCGCLSSVSTFIGEIIKMAAVKVKLVDTASDMRAQPKLSAAAPLYAFTTIAVGCAVGSLCYSFHVCSHENNWCHTEDSGWKLLYEDRPTPKFEDPEESIPHHLLGEDQHKKPNI